MSEEPKIVEKKPSPQNDCVIIPEHMKPLLECCQNYEQGKIGAEAFFAQALTKTGEFMQEVAKRKNMKAE